MLIFLLILYYYTITPTTTTIILRTATHHPSDPESAGSPPLSPLPSIHECTFVTRLALIFPPRLFTQRREGGSADTTHTFTPRHPPPPPRPNPKHPTSTPVPPCPRPHPHVVTTLATPSSTYSNKSMYRLLIAVPARFYQQLKTTVYNHVLATVLDAIY